MQLVACRDPRKALFLTVNNALGDVKDFFREGLREVAGHFSWSDRHEAKV